MLLGSFWIDYPVLEEALSNATDVTLHWEKSDLTEDGGHQLLVWVSGDSYAAFDAGLEADPTVEAPSRVVSFDERRLYQLELTPAGQRASVYPLVVEIGGVLERVTGSHQGWKFRAAFPDEGALERFHGFFRERNVEIDLQSLYEERNPHRANRYGLTDEQHETLVAAVETGYLDIPRSCSLAELGERFDVSSNATSERFRRGVKTLVQNTIYDESSGR